MIGCLRRLLAWRALEAAACDPTVSAEDVRALCDKHFRHPSAEDEARIIELFDGKERLWEGRMQTPTWELERHCESKRVDNHGWCGWWLYSSGGLRRRHEREAAGD